MTSPLHKTIIPELSSKAASKSSLKPAPLENLPNIDIEKENRLSKIISLYSRGRTQSERNIEKYLNEDILMDQTR